MEVNINITLELYPKKESVSRQKIPARASNDEHRHYRCHRGCSSAYKKPGEVQLEVGINNIGWSVG